MIQYELYIPSEFTDIIEYAESVLTYHYGGATSYSASGTWVNHENLPITEPITIIRTLSQKDDDYHLEYLVERVRRKCNQDEVLWTKQPISITFHKG